MATAVRTFAIRRPYGCPSKHLALRLDVVDWDAKWIRIDSPKTEHHNGRAFRIVPLFSELHSYLEEVWHQAGVDQSIAPADSATREIGCPWERFPKVLESRTLTGRSVVGGVWSAHPPAFASARISEQVVTCCRRQVAKRSRWLTTLRYDLPCRYTHYVDGFSRGG